MNRQLGDGIRIGGGFGFATIFTLGALGLLLFAVSDTLLSPGSKARRPPPPPAGFGTFMR
jgi:hypothetical protein